MRVVAIRGCDLASLQGEFALELDRPPLSGLGLFAIHGPVGAGKSTLLDALCLGLYGRTPRLSGVGGALVGGADEDELKSNDPRTLVRRGSTLSYAEVDFSGVDGRLYRARWEVKRGRRKNGVQRLQAEKQSLVDVISGLRIGDTNSEVRAQVQARLGLSFDELCRSVLLAQGGFQGFLQARPNERGALLEKVTGTALYSRLSIAAHERARTLRDDETLLVQRRAALRVLDADLRGQREADAQAASIVAGSAEDAAALLAAQVDAGRARGALVRAIDEAMRAVHHAQATAAAASERKKRAGDAAAVALAAADRARPALEAARQLDARIEALSTSTAVSAWRQAEAGHQRAQAELEALRQQLKETQGRQDAARAEMNDDTAAFVDVIDAVVLGLERLERARLEVEGAEAMVAAAARDKAEADVDVAARTQVLAGLVPLRPAQLVGRCLDTVLAGLLADVVDVEAARQVGLGQDLVVAHQVRERLVRALSKTQERALLEDGEPCPLCGSVEHPWSAGAPWHGVVDDEDQRIAALEAARQRSVSRLADARARLQGLPAPQPPVLAGWSIGVVDGLRAQDRAAVQARRALDEAQTRADDLARDHAFQCAALAAKQAVVVDVEAALRGLHVPEADLRDPRRRKTVLVGEAKRYLRARDIHVATLKELARLSQEHAGALARSEACAAALSSSSALVADLESRALELRTARAGVLGGEVAIVEAELDRACADARAGDSDAAHALAAAQSSSSTAGAVLAERLSRLTPGPVSDLAALELEAAVARSAASSAREHHALLRAGLQHDALLAAQAAVVDDAILAHRQSARVWWELAAVIGSADGARFRQFAQGLTLDALVVHANEHLKILAPRYRLQRVATTAARHDLELVVVDLDSADEVRSTSTLSGGESFLVSLALALGLSSLSANEGARGRVESLFIDEGFSALDADTLDVALSAFDALRQTGRQIGVISHVPLLVERIGSQVRIVPMGGGASRVEIHAG